MKKTAIIGVAALLLLGLIAADAFAFGGHLRGDSAAGDALEAGDYDAYLAALDEGFQTRKGQQMTEEKFGEMAGRYQEMAEKRAVIEERREQLHAAMDEGYESWRVLVDSMDPQPRFADGITEENFEQFVELRDTMEHAQELRDELGFGERMGHGRFGHRMH
ncbi:MAG: hypothetical protein KAH93_02015 [Candidatus Aenigmarchaeota archaeon]|nr:hypothetical protein [Candidatus Aenigmarchaeota archaeon]